MFLAPSSDNKSRNHEIEWSDHHPSVSTLRQKRLSHSKIKWWAIYTNLSVNVIVRLPHPQSGDSKHQETFLAHSAEESTGNNDIECSNHLPSLWNLRPNGLRHSNMKWWVIYANLPVNVIAKPPHPWNGDSPGHETIFSTHCWQVNLQP